MKQKKIGAAITAAPHVVWSILFIAAPLLFVIFYAFTSPEGGFTLDNITALAEYGDIFRTSIEMSIIATFCCFAVGYPLAYFMSRATERQKKIYMILLMLPMWTNLLIRTYSMMAILDDGGFLNTILLALDMAPVHIVGTKGAVIFGMAYDFFPYMVLPIYTAISKIDKRFIEAANDLGC
ncbi:MAG: ABC transporter permease, partial [Clostridia bacterium]|nr:ABC transporter permease [Clostridia bacterium]